MTRRESYDMLTAIHEEDSFEKYEGSHLSCFAPNPSTQRVSTSQQIHHQQQTFFKRQAVLFNIPS